jgi:hypothetical protein
MLAVVQGLGAEVVALAVVYSLTAAAAASLVAAAAVLVE